PSQLRLRFRSRLLPNSSPGSSRISSQRLRTPLVSEHRADSSAEIPMDPSPADARFRPYAFHEQNGWQWPRDRDTNPGAEANRTDEIRFADSARHRESR